MLFTVLTSVTDRRECLTDFSTPLRSTAPFFFFFFVYWRRCWFSAILEWRHVQSIDSRGLPSYPEWFVYKGIQLSNFNDNAIVRDPTPRLNTVLNSTNYFFLPSKPATRFVTKASGEGSCRRRQNHVSVSLVEVASAVLVASCSVRQTEAICHCFTVNLHDTVPILRMTASREVIKISLFIYELNKEKTHNGSPVSCLIGPSLFSERFVKGELRKRARVLCSDKERFSFFSILHQFLCQIE